MSSGDGMNDRTVQWLEQGRAEGLVEGRSRHRQTQINAMCRMAARKFDDATAEELHGRMQWIVEQEQIGEIGERLIECAHADAFLNRVDEPSLETISDLMLERAKEYEAHWRAIGRAEGLATFQKQYRAQQVEVLCRMAARKFDQETRNAFTERWLDSGIRSGSESSACGSPIPSAPTHSSIRWRSRRRTTARTR